ncbi:unnamed protein product, partial [Urochloa humidicola]
VSSIDGRARPLLQAWGGGGGGASPGSICDGAVARFARGGRSSGLRTEDGAHEAGRPLLSDAEEEQGAEDNLGARHRRAQRLLRCLPGRAHRAEQRRPGGARGFSLSLSSPVAGGKTTRGEAAEAVARVGSTSSHSAPSPFPSPGRQKADPVRSQGEKLDFVGAGAWERAARFGWRRPISSSPSPAAA